MVLKNVAILSKKLIGQNVIRMRELEDIAVFITLVPNVLQ